MFQYKKTQPSESEPSLATYDYVDIASGQGYVNYYAAVLSGAYLLTNSTNLYSENVETFWSTTAASPTKYVDYSFDSEFNLPRTSKGDAFINIPVQLGKTNSSASTGSLYTHAAISKVNLAGTDEFIVSGATALIKILGAAAGEEERMHALKLAIPLTQFKKGEKLRLNIKAWNERTNGIDWETCALGHDPKNRTGSRITTINTNLILQMPFRINV